MRKVGRAVRRAELVTAHRKKIDFAHTVRYLVDGLYPDTGRSGSYHGAGVFLLYAATWIMAEQGGDWVEGDHAELCHFSHCLKALRRAVKLFLSVWNHRQPYKQQSPHYSAHVMV